MHTIWMGQEDRWGVLLWGGAVSVECFAERKLLRCEIYVLGVKIWAVLPYALSPS